MKVGLLLVFVSVLACVLCIYQLYIICYFFSRKAF